MRINECSVVARQIQQRCIYLEAGHCSSILPVQVETHLGDLALLDPQLVQHVLCNLASRYSASLQVIKQEKLATSIVRTLYVLAAC